MTYPTLAKAPIVEAVIDFRLRPEQAIPLDVIGSIHDRIAKDYPQKQENKILHLGFVIGPENTTQQPVNDNTVGYRFEDTVNKYVFQARKDGFSLSKLRPYDQWPSFLEEAKRLSEIYFDTVGEQQIVRTAVRYINRLELPSEDLNFDDYLVVGPRVPEGLPDVLIEFLTRNVIPCEEQRSTVVITQALEGATAEGKVSVLLDIDAICTEAYLSSGCKKWEILDILRELKNKVFFKSVHSKTLELFK